MLQPAHDSDIHSVNATQLTLQSVQVGERLSGVVVRAASVDNRERIGELGALNNSRGAAAKHYDVDSETCENVDDIINMACV